MLSILIPVFNENITTLANDLKRVIHETTSDIEVIFGDDASSDVVVQSQNIEHIDKWPNFKYVIQNTNLGFCENRNVLGNLAKFDNLLFLDADTRINDRLFLNNWMQQLKSQQVVCGGNIFAVNAPKEKDLFLKWKHSKTREEANAASRNRQPWRRFSASNFLISKELFQSHPFQSSGKKYGYNDTVYGYKLRKEGINISHIDNPVLNEGLFGKDKFISRSKEAISNLIDFEQKFKMDPEFQGHIKVLKLYYDIRRAGLIRPTYLVLRLLEPSLIRNLSSTNPSLISLDLLKILWLIESKKRTQTN